MKIQILEETKDKLKFKMFSTRVTVPEMLQKQLLTHKEVINASGIMNHPEDKDSVFILQTKNANPKDILIKSIEELQKEINNFKDEMLKAIPEEHKLKGSVKKKAK
jgi:DNA-directed RNA polymerase subunit L